jgi:hypothetical protein
VRLCDPAPVYFNSITYCSISDIETLIDQIDFDTPSSSSPLLAALCPRSIALCCTVSGEQCFRCFRGPSRGSFSRSISPRIEGLWVKRTQQLPTQRWQRLEGSRTSMDRLPQGLSKAHNWYCGRNTWVVMDS